MVTNMVTKGRGRGEVPISAATFKATCLELMDEVERTGTTVVHRYRRGTAPGLAR